MGRLVIDDRKATVTAFLSSITSLPIDERKATVTQITTRYNQCMQNTSLNAQHVEL